MTDAPLCFEKTVTAPNISPACLAGIQSKKVIFKSKKDEMIAIKLQYSDVKIITLFINTMTS